MARRTIEHAQGLRDLAGRDPHGTLALAVVELAVREAAAGDRAAAAWLDQLRADVIEAAPRGLAERWTAAEPAPILDGRLLARRDRLDRVRATVEAYNWPARPITGEALDRLARDLGTTRSAVDRYVRELVRQEGQAARGRPRLAPAAD